MSRYKCRFHVSTGMIHGKIEEVVDLVDDWGHSEEELDILTPEETEKFLNDLYLEWLDQNTEGGAYLE